VGKKKSTKWIHTTPSVLMPHFMMKSESFKSLPGSAVKLYLEMRMSCFDADNGYRNTDELTVSFGPSDVKHFSHRKYYGALKKLIEYGFVKVVSHGCHGKKAVYDLLTLDWIGD
jgi:hypothetical protein